MTGSTIACSAYLTATGASSYLINFWASGRPALAAICRVGWARDAGAIDACWGCGLPLNIRGEGGWTGATADKARAELGDKEGVGVGEGDGDREVGGARVTGG
mmetsp:Transcript_58371/g.123828  ORF Transcript_58371/g.123828 Transcript_58371/m.123828 type:complete len:103 (+) Transcript_58371:1415-1723(+)